MTVEYITGLLPFKKYASFVFLPDWHYPFNLFTDAYLAMLSDNPPDYFIYGGDVVNNDPFNHWAKNIPRKTKEMPNPQEYFHGANEDLFKLVRQALGKRTKIIYILGNHEDWSNKAVDMIPELKGWAEVEQNIQKEYIDLYVKERTVIELGEMAFTHGDNIYYAKNQHAKKMAIYLHQTTMFGHYHDYEVHTLSLPPQKKPILGISVPCSTILDPLSYGKHLPTNRSHGFGWGTVRPDGIVDWGVTPIRNGEFVYKEKRYKSRILEPKKLSFEM